jgi:asparagine synthase (glutamine-hydrolysing)
VCGLWASVGVAVSRAAIDLIAHRGPDGAGWQELDTHAGRVCLGHRLLAISGERACPQPLRARAGRSALVYNGEIYNHASLRKQLSGSAPKPERAEATVVPGAAAAPGASATPGAPETGDTAVVLAALDAWGEQALPQFEGMYALVHIDLERNRMLAARDRFGIKPLYFWCGAGIMALASEIKQFTALPGFAARLNLQRARDFLDLGVTDHAGDTLWHGVQVVQPGECIELRLDRPGAAPRRSQWYRPRVRAVRPAELALANSEFAAALIQAVHSRARTRAAAAVSLSGGLDSSAVVALLPQPLPCFSLQHAQPEIDESRFAQAVAAHRGLSLQSAKVPADELPALVDQAVAHLDEPFPSLSAVAQWVVFREAARAGVRVMLTGQGADELLGGYPFLYGTLLVELLRRGRLRRMVREISERVPPGGTGRAFGALLPAAVLPTAVLRGWADPGLARARLAVRRGGRRDQATRGLGAFRVDLLGPANLGMVLRYEDRTAMAHGIEARPPFLDHRVVEAALRIPGDALIRGGVTKQPLRAALSGQLPALVLERRDKLGFPAPEAMWLRGPLRDYALSKAAAARARFPHLIGHADVELVRMELESAGPLRAPVWRLACLGAWAERFDVSAASDR